MKQSILLVIFCLAITLLLTGCWYDSPKANCEKSIKNNPDLYCYNRWYGVMNNGDDWDDGWAVGSHTTDSVNAEAERARAQARKECYDSGKDYAYSFDIMRDYNLTCSKIAYINDHLIDQTRQVDGGYISGYYSGFFSGGYVEGHLYQYVTEGILATGQLVENISYHIDCHNSTEPLEGQCNGGGRCSSNGGPWHCCEGGPMDTVITNYYSESDFVMYYVNKCVKE